MSETNTEYRIVQVERAVDDIQEWREKMNGDYISLSSKVKGVEDVLHAILTTTRSIFLVSLGSCITALLGFFYQFAMRGH